MNSIKCPDCGLVNFSTAPECKRCHLSFQSETAAPEAHYGSSAYENSRYGNTSYADRQYAGSQNNYWPEGPPEEKKRVFSGAVMFLSGIFGVAMFCCIAQQVFHPLAPDTAKGVGGLIGVFGILLMVLAHIWLLIRIFEQSVGWGLASLFLPVAGYIAVGKFWEKTKRSFVGQLVCVGIVFVGLGIGF
jgi:hypothetical protein